MQYIVIIYMSGGNSKAPEIKGNEFLKETCPEISKKRQELPEQSKPPSASSTQRFFQKSRGVKAHLPAGSHHPFTLHYARTTYFITATEHSP